MEFTREEIEEIESWVKSPTFDKVFSTIHFDQTSKWVAADTLEKRERCWMYIQALGGLSIVMKNIVNAGKVDEHNASRSRANDWKMPRPN